MVGPCRYLSFSKRWNKRAEKTPLLIVLLYKKSETYPATAQLMCNGKGPTVRDASCETFLVRLETGR